MFCSLETLVCQFIIKYFIHDKSIENCWYAKLLINKEVKNACKFIIVSVILYHGGQHFWPQHLLIRDKKTPPPILYIKASTVVKSIIVRSCFTKLFHRLIRNRAGYSSKDEHKQQFKDILGVVDCSFTIFTLHQK